MADIVSITSVSEWSKADFFEPHGISYHLATVSSWEKRSRLTATQPECGFELGITWPAVLTEDIELQSGRSQGENEKIRIKENKPIIIELL